MNSTLIITGGDINLDFAEKYYKENEFSLVIAVDGGLRAADQLRIIPNYIVGDFDTISPLALYKYENMENVKLKRFKPEKDFTDTQVAIKTAIEENSFEIHILGGTGSRIDHTLGNIQLLQEALSNGIEAIIISDKNRIRLLGKKRKNITLHKDGYRYVSLMPLTDVVTSVSTIGMKYDITNHDFYIDREISLGISNEILDKEAMVSIGHGTLLLIESNDWWATAKSPYDRNLV